MCKYLKFIFVIPLFFIGCSIKTHEPSETSEPSLPYIGCAWIMWDDLVNKEYCEEDQDSMFVDGTKALYNGMSFTEPPHGGDCTDYEYNCSSIKYYRNLGYVEYRLSTLWPNPPDSTIYSYDLTEKTNVRYREPDDDLPCFFCP